MSNVEQVIRRAVTDAEFRGMLLSDPDKALAGYSLTDEEAAKLRGLEPSFFEGDAGELEDRISRWGHQCGAGSSVPCALNSTPGGQPGANHAPSRR